MRCAPSSTRLWHGVTDEFDTLLAAFAPYLDRAPEQLSPIEKGVLAIGAWELLRAPDIPYRVVINEAVELAKAFGGTDGHKYVNGVLDKLAAALRPAEVASPRVASLTRRSARSRQITLGSAVVSALSEFELIDRFFRAPRASQQCSGWATTRPCSRPRRAANSPSRSTCWLRAGIFSPTSIPQALGHKTLAVNLSDMAAMGALPRWALLAGALPDADRDWIAAFASGFFALADAFAVDLVGGDTTRGPLNLCVTILGEAPPGRRCGAAGPDRGEAIFVSGQLGGRRARARPPSRRGRA